MITFTPTSEQQMLIDTVHRFAESNVRKVAHDADEASQSPSEVVAKGWELGILPGLIPEAYGGYADDAPALTGVLALEELGWGDLSIGLEVLTPALFALSVLAAGSEEQKKTYLPRFCGSDRPIMTAALVEPSLAFDPWRPAVTASASGDSVTLSGEKTYVPLAADAEAMIVFARDSKTGRVDGYVVEKGAPGLEICERNQLMGLRAMPTYRIRLSEVRLPVSARLGGENGSDYAKILNRSRVALAALAVGVARASFEYARDYAKERVQFGVAIGTKQAVAFRLADAAIEIDAARLMTWETAWKADQGQDITRDAAILKQYIVRMSLFATDTGVQVLGGHGYIREHPVERWLRNARGFVTFDGLALV